MGMQAQAIEYEKPFAEAREKFEGLIGEMSTASTMQMSHSELEKLVQERGTALLRQMMQDHLELRSLKEERKEVIGQDGKRRGEVKQNERGLMTIFGPVRVNRLGYRGKAARSLHPMDKELNLPKEYYSHGLRRRAAEEAAKSSFDEVIETIKKTTGASLAKRQAEELALRAAEDFEEFYAGRTQQQESKGSILVLSTDAKGVVMRKDDLRKATRKAAEKKNHKLEKRLSKGEKRHRKRQAQVASVYTISPFVRSAEDVVNEFRPLKEAELKRPSPENKRVWASLEQSAKEVIGEAFSEAQRRDPQRKKTWAVLVDGNLSQLDVIERKAESLGLKLLIILDLIHVLGYLWKAAFAFHKEGSKEAEDWVSERLLRLLQGKSPHVAAGMRRSATLLKLRKKQRENVDKCADYFLKYGEYLHYDQYLALGLPIATGVIEGACRHLVQDRMDITGARWRMKGAEAVLRLRSLRASKDFDAYWSFHLEKELHRNHSSHYFNDAAH